MDDNNEELDEMQAERENRLAEQSGKEALQKKQKEQEKKKMRKVIIKMIIAKIQAALLTLLMIGLPIILISAIFVALFDGDSTNTYDENAIYSTEDYVVNTEIEGAAPVLDEDQLETAIETLYAGEAKENLLSAMDGLMDIQDTYHVNAVFAIAVFQLESNCRNSLGSNFSRNI